MAQTLQHTQDRFRLSLHRNKSVHARLNVEKSTRAKEVRNKQFEQMECWLPTNNLQSVERLSFDLDVMLCMPSGLRVVRKAFDTDPRLLPRQYASIASEVALLRTFIHPNLVRVYGTSADAGSVYVLSEFCEGGNLESIAKTVVKRNGIVGEVVLGKICEGVLNGLAFLESKCIAVAELRPCNIFVTREGEIKLNEYGSFYTDSCIMSQVSAPKPVYASPERIKGDSYTIANLVWSLGIIIVELADNKYPFNTKDSVSLLGLLMKIVRDQPPKLGNSNSWSDDLRCFTKTCLIKDPIHRPTPSKLIEHPFIRWSKTRKVNMKKWIRQVWEWDS